jgi:Rieske Fe-S protein
MLTPGGETPAPGVGSCEGCPWTVRPGRSAGPSPYPVGVVRRVAAVEPPIADDDDHVDETRRSILKLAVIAGAVAAASAGGAVALRYLVPPPGGLGSYPRVQLLYDDGTPILASKYPYGPTTTELMLFDYPLTNEPNMLLNLAAAAPNGVGPNSSLVAFSAICQHQGSQAPYISYYPPGSCGTFNGGNAFIHCTVHGSTYDPAVAAPGGGATLITGPASNPLPQLLLAWDSATDYLYAVGAVGPPVFGHGSSSLSGGSGVASQVQLQPPVTPQQQCPTA